MRALQERISAATEKWRIPLCEIKFESHEVPRLYRYKPSDVIEIGHPYFCKIVVMHYATTPKPRASGGAVIYVEYR